MGFSKQEYWSGLPCPPPGDLPDPGIEPMSLMSSAVAGGFFTTSALWEAQNLSNTQRTSRLQTAPFRARAWTWIHKSDSYPVASDSLQPYGLSAPGSSVHGILQARILEWVAMPSSEDFPDPGNEPVSLMSPVLAGRFFTTSATFEAPCIQIF